MLRSLEVRTVEFYLRVLGCLQTRSNIWTGSSKMNERASGEGRNCTQVKGWEKGGPLKNGKQCDQGRKGDVGCVCVHLKDIKGTIPAKEFIFYFGKNGKILEQKSRWSYSCFRKSSFVACARWLEGENRTEGYSLGQLRVSLLSVHAYTCVPIKTCVYTCMYIHPPQQIFH